MCPPIDSMIAHSGEFSVLYNFFEVLHGGNNNTTSDANRAIQSSFYHHMTVESNVFCRFTDSGLREVLIQRVIFSTNALAVAFIGFESGDVHSAYKGMARSIMSSDFLQLSSPVSKNQTTVYT